MTQLQAHRGVSYEYPENTLVAYKAAVEQGYGIIELDPKYTKDGKIVMLHDKTIQRTGRDAQGQITEKPIVEMTLQEVQQYEYGSWFDEKFRGIEIPTLSDVLDFAEKNTKVPLKFDNVWNKFPTDIRAAFLSEIAERGEKVNVGFTCSNLESLQEAANAMPTATLHYDGIDVREETLKEIKRIAGSHRLVIWLCFDTPATKWYKGERASESLCALVRKYGEVGIWLLSEKEELRKAIFSYAADFVETNGKLKPGFVNEIMKEK